MNVVAQWEQEHQKTINKDYKYHINVFLQTANFTISEATYQDIMEYLQTLRKSGASLYVLKNRLAAIKFYYRCLLAHKEIQYHPCKNLTLHDKTTTLQATEVLYSDTELETFLQRSIGTTKPLQLRNTIIQQLLVYQGLTTTELVTLKVTDINLEKCTIYIEENYLQERTLPLQATQLLPLHNYLTTIRKKLVGKQQTTILLLSKTGKALPSETLSAMLNRGFKSKLLPKRIRQSVITNLLKKGNDLRSVQLFAGYRDITTVESYKNKDIEALKNAILQHHPLG